MAEPSFDTFNQIFAENSAWLQAYIDARLQFPFANNKEKRALSDGLGALAIVNNEDTALSEDEIMKAYAGRERLLWKYNPTWAMEEMAANPFYARAAAGLVYLLVEEDIPQQQLEASQ